MATGAPKFFAVRHLIQVRLVVETHPFFKGYFPLYQPGFVASFAQATFVGYLGPRPGFFVGKARVFDELHQAHQLPVNFPLKAGREMAFYAFHLFVFGVFPTVVKRLHVVAGNAERRARSVKRRPHGEDKKENKGGERIKKVPCFSTHSKPP
jgi:hypothetical protein